MMLTDLFNCGEERIALFLDTAIADLRVALPKFACTAGLPVRPYPPRRCRYSSACQNMRCSNCEKDGKI